MHVDLTYLLGVSGGDKKFIKEILKLFIEQTLPDFERLKKVVMDQDWHTTSSVAHKIKSSVSMLGNEKALEWVVLIENLAKQKEGIQEIEGIIKLLENEIQFMSNEINEYIEKN